MCRRTSNLFTDGSTRKIACGGPAKKAAFSTIYAEKGRLTRLVPDISQGDEGHVYVGKKLSDHRGLYDMFVQYIT